MQPTSRPDPARKWIRLASACPGCIVAQTVAAPEKKAVCVVDKHFQHTCTTLTVLTFTAVLVSILSVFGPRFPLIAMLHLVLYPAVESVSKDSSLVVIRQLSGELICALEPEQLEQLASSHGDSVRVLKQHLAELRGESRYKVKLVTQGRVLQDQELK